jgi:predicted MFS family arabinose efflux permease
VPVATLALAWKWICLPKMAPEVDSGSRNPLRLLKQARVALGMTAVSLFFMGQFALFTYLRPFLETATGVDARTLTALLLLIGVAGVVGTTLIGRFVEHGLNRTLLVIPLAMMVIAAALPIIGHSLGTTAVMLGFWGLLGTAAPVAWWTWLARTLPHDAEAGGGLMVAVVQLAIGLGAALGGVLFDAIGYAATFATSAIMLLLSAAFAVAAARSSREPIDFAITEFETVCT